MRPERLGSGNPADLAATVPVLLASMRPERLGSGNLEDLGEIERKVFELQ